jgi:hypothetical protein
MTHPIFFSKPTGRGLKERLLVGRATLGEEKADAIVEALEKKLGFFPNMKSRAEAFEQALGAGPSAPHVTPTAAAPVSLQARADAIVKALQNQRTRSSSASTAELCAQYNALASEEQRRAFWRRNEKALSEAEVGGLVLVCMSAAKPLSLRARLQLPAANKAELVLTRAEWRSLSPYDQGTFKAMGGKIVPETMKRAIFEKLSARDRGQVCRDGVVITD